MSGLKYQVMNKLNIELAYARADLSEALYQHRGDINTARKRVIWLEDRMGKLYGKTHYKVHFDQTHQLLKLQVMFVVFFAEF